MHTGKMAAPDGSCSPGKLYALADTISAPVLVPSRRPAVERTKSRAPAAADTPEHRHELAHTSQPQAEQPRHKYAWLRRAGQGRKAQASQRAAAGAAASSPDLKRHVLPRSASCAFGKEERFGSSKEFQKHAPLPQEHGVGPGQHGVGVQSSIGSAGAPAFSMSRAKRPLFSEFSDSDSVPGPGAYSLLPEQKAEEVELAHKLALAAQPQSREDEALDGDDFVLSSWPQHAWEDALSATWGHDGCPPSPQAPMSSKAPAAGRSALSYRFRHTIAEVTKRMGLLQHRRARSAPGRERQSEPERASPLPGVSPGQSVEGMPLEEHEKPLSPHEHSRTPSPQATQAQSTLYKGRAMSSHCSLRPVAHIVEMASRSALESRPATVQRASREQQSRLYRGSSPLHNSHLLGTASPGPSFFPDSSPRRLEGGVRGKPSVPSRPRKQKQPHAGSPGPSYMPPSSFGRQALSGCASAPALSTGTSTRQQQRRRFLSDALQEPGQDSPGVGRFMPASSLHPSSAFVPRCGREARAGPAAQDTPAPNAYQRVELPPPKRVIDPVTGEVLGSKISAAAIAAAAAASQ